jgi:hypothetical protein
MHKIGLRPTLGELLVYELFRGSITSKELDWSEAQIREFVVSHRTSRAHHPCTGENTGALVTPLQECGSPLRDT